jgi:hypothetical protein
MAIQDGALRTETEKGTGSVQDGALRTEAEKEAAAGETLDAVGGSYAITGTVANLEHHSIIDSVGGSYAISGTAVGLVYSPVVRIPTTVQALTLVN